MQKMSKEAGVMKFFYNGIKVHRLGNSAAIIIPAMWVKLYGLKVNGTYYISMSNDGNKFIIEPISEDKEKVKATLERNDVKSAEVS